MFTVCVSVFIERLSGLSPFLGDDDNETLNNILACKWDLDDAEFENVSEDAKEFISKLLIKEKGYVYLNLILFYSTDCTVCYGMLWVMVMGVCQIFKWNVFFNGTLSN